MSLEALTEQLKTQATMNPPLGYRVKFDLGEDGVLLWDGTVTPPEIGLLVGSGDGDPEADTVLRLTLDDLGRLLSGTLDPTLAYMTGKLKIQGSTEIGRAHVCTPVTNAHLVCRLLLEKKNTKR